MPLEQKLNKVVELPDSQEKHEKLLKFKDKLPKYSNTYFDLGVLTKDFEYFDDSKNCYEIPKKSIKIIELMK